MATVAAMALTTVEPSLASAGSTPVGKGATAATPPAMSPTSAPGAGIYRGGGGAAAAAAFAGIVGTGLAIAATQNRRDYYDYYDGAPAITAAARSITAVAPAITAAMAIGSGVPYFRGHPIAGW